MSKNSISTFIKVQFSSIISTVIDFSITWILTSLIGFWYIFSSSTGSAIGGITNFILGRCWVFRTTNTKVVKQILMYFLMWAGGIILNTTGVYLFTEVFKMHYMFSKVLVAGLIGVFLNYYLQSNFVFNEHISQR
jgi:putative flippase GtrA